MRDARLITRVDRLAQGDVTVVLEPLEFIKLIHRYEHCRGRPVLRQHNTLMAAPGTINQLGEMTVGLRTGHVSVIPARYSRTPTVSGTARHSDVARFQEHLQDDPEPGRPVVAG